MSTPEILEAYRASRDQHTDTSVLCHAPFVSLNFPENGRVTVCCYNRTFTLGTYPESSVQQIWTGASARALREAFLRNEEAPGCGNCFHQLKNRNFGGALMRNFDGFSHDADYTPEIEAPAPRVLEFNLTNTCNLECVMCGGKWSSAIRARREKLPPLKSPYDRAFVEQLEEFLPSIVAARFLGGEPFLIKRYYEIWERLRRANPDAVLSITTNATIVPQRARDLLEELHANIVISLDSVVPATYEAIRTNARFDQVMANFEYFLDYTHRRGTKVSLAVCPMTYNWRELPAILEFCEKHELMLAFNTVFRPVKASLGGLSSTELREVIDYLEGFRPPTGGAPWRRRNLSQWDGLINQLRGWLEDKLEFAGKCSGLEARFRGFAARHPKAVAGWAAPDGFDRLVSPLVASFSFARERANRNRTELLTLPNTPIALSENGETPDVQDILRATHLLCRCLDELEEGRPIAGEEALLEEQQRLLDYLSRRDGSEEQSVEEFGLSLKEQIRWGQGDELVRWLRTLLDADGRPDRSQRKLDEGLALLRRRGLDEAASRKVATYFEALVAQLRNAGKLSGVEVPAHAPWMGASGDALATVSGVSAGPLLVRGFDDLRSMTDAMYLFHRGYDAGDHEVFRRRIDTCLAAVSGSGKEAMVWRWLESANLAWVYEYLSHASDEELKRALDPIQ